MRLSKILRLDYTSLLIPITLCLEEQFDYVLALLLAATVHECGHLLAARLLGISVLSMHVSVFGAHLQLSDPLISYKNEWLLCAAGPLFSGLLALVCLTCSSLLPQLPLLTSLGEISIVLGTVNLLPVGWLDGGRMLHAICYQLFTPIVARAIVQSVSFFFFLALWMSSVYLILRAGHSLSLFVFSFSLFLRFFQPKPK